MEYFLPIWFAAVLALAIAASLEAVNPHRERGGTFTPWTAGALWLIVFLFAIFLFKLHT